MTTNELLSPLRRAIKDFNLIEDNDKIAVGLSGGKDSVTLLSLLASYKKFSPQKFDLVAITVDLNFTDQKTDYAPLQKFCDELNVPFYIEKTEIGQIVFETRKESNPCSLCSKMRKGALNSVAKSLSCNKVALGHHADDLIETFFLSMFYEGRLSTFAPKSFLDRMEITQIRPMIYIEERDILSFSKNLPITKSCCPANNQTKRELIKQQINAIKKDIPFVRERIFTALTHPERYNLFDKF